MKNYTDAVLDFVQDCYYEDALKDEPHPMTLEDALYNLTCMVEDEYTDVPEDLTAEDFMLIWNELVTNGGRLPACEGSETDVEYNHKTEEENKMKYQIDFTDDRTGSTSAIDTVTAPAGYTAEDYIRGCEENADQEWVDMIHAGTVTVIPIDNDTSTVSYAVHQTTVTRIDVIDVPEGFTAEDYIRACEEGSEPDWVEKIHTGKISLVRLRPGADNLTVPLDVTSGDPDAI